MRAATCLLCGHEGHDVRMALVEVEKPERMVEVVVPVNHRRDAVEVKLTVPERFYAVPRCTDEAACRLRELAVEAPVVVVPEEPPIAEDPTAWL